ncbi:MAG: Gfo/Idh/MocA family oxidoreductase [Fibrobacter sp.]|nr:Gfo/Idh/MocA family oxidoreductase [Fibrobacter sp.]
MVCIGVIGYGYWGPNIVRNFNGTGGARVVAVSDKNSAILEKVKGLYSGIAVMDNPMDLIRSPSIDAVAIVTPVSTHYELARAALENGKHVFVEKPFTANVAQAEELIEIAETKNLRIMVDHTFIFTGAVRRIKEFIDTGELGKIYYYDSIRVNLGLFQHDINVVWDLAPHDFSIMSYIIPEQPLAVSAWGKSHINDLEDIAYITVHFKSSIIAHFSVNWLSPVKMRTTLIGGEKKMLVWNDVAPDEKIKIYDKGVKIENRQGIYDLLVSYRSGDMWAPMIEQTEALKLECLHFVESIEKNFTPLNSGQSGLEVVKMLEACDKSIRNDGHPVEIKTTQLADVSFFEEGSGDEEPEI